MQLAALTPPTRAHSSPCTHASPPHAQEPLRPFSCVPTRTWAAPGLQAALSDPCMHQVNVNRAPRAVWIRVHQCKPVPQSPAAQMQPCCSPVSPRFAQSPWHAPDPCVARVCTVLSFPCTLTYTWTPLNLNTADMSLSFCQKSLLPPSRSSLELHKPRSWGLLQSDAGVTGPDSAQVQRGSRIAPLIQVKGAASTWISINVSRSCCCGPCWSW